MMAAGRVFLVTGVITFGLISLVGEYRLSYLYIYVRKLLMKCFALSLETSDWIVIGI